MVRQGGDLTTFDTNISKCMLLYRRYIQKYLNDRCSSLLSKDHPSLRYFCVDLTIQSLEIDCVSLWLIGISLCRIVYKLIGISLDSIGTEWNRWDQKVNVKKYSILQSVIYCESVRGWRTFDCAWFTRL